MAAVVLLLFGLGSFAVYGASGTGGFRIFTLKHISPEQGREYLGRIGLGTVSQLSGSPSLLVTGEPEDVAKAKAVLGLVDASQGFSVKTLGSLLRAEHLPASAAISEKAGGISVGTFSSPPKDAGGAGAIVDVHNGSLVLIAPSSKMERIVAAVGQLLEAKKERTASRQEASVEATKVPDKPTKPRVDKIEVVGPADANEPRKVAVGPDRAGPKTTPAQSPPEKPSGLYRPAPRVNARDVLKVTLPEKLDIIRLLQLAGEFLDLTFMYDPVKIKGEVTILWTGDQRGSIRIEELYPLLESVMQFHGFAMTLNEGANIVTVTPLAEVMEKDPPLVETEADQITEYGQVVVTRIFKLEHIDATSAKNLLDGMKLGEASPVGDAKVLFVTGYAYRMPRVERLLKMIDKPGKPKKIKFRQLKFTMATALAPKIKTLAEQLGTVSVTVGQMSTPSATISGRRERETTTQYTARLQKERLAARTRISTPATPSAAAQPGVFLDADERTNRILMIGFDEQLDDVEELIDTLDVEQTDLRTLKPYIIEHIDAEQARLKLQELQVISGGGSSSSSGSRITGPATRIGAATKSLPTQKPPASTRTSMNTSGSGLQALVEEPLVVVIEATNSLLVNATAEQHAQIEIILKYVDSKTDADTIPYVIYPLENQKPEDLAAILEKLIQETVKDKEGKIQQVIKKTEEEIVIVPDENTFSIIVYASKRNQEWIKSLIETLDKRRPQVLIDVTLVKVWKDEEFNYGLNLVKSFPDLVHTSQFGGIIKPGDDPVLTDSILSALDDAGRKRFVDFQSHGGSATAFYGDEHVNALLTAVQSKNYGRILAKPKILVNDNEQGTISTTKITYIKKTSSLPMRSQDETGASYNTVTTAIDYEPYEAGITLDITPHISEGDLLRLEIMLTRTDFEEKTGGEASTTGDQAPPNTTGTDITTIVTVPDGSTIILGGMITLGQSKGGSKVPLLGDIPLIGALFRSSGKKDKQDKLYIFVKAEIIRPAETLAQGLPDLERISDRNRMAFERFEDEFQSYKNFPGIKARSAEPLKVLEAE